MPPEILPRLKSSRYFFFLSVQDAPSKEREAATAAAESDMGWCTGVEHGQWDGLLVSYRWPVASYIVHDACTVRASELFSPSAYIILPG